MSAAHTFVFVYGSLLRGEPNHRLLARSYFVTRAITAPRYQLVDLGAFPAMLDRGRTTVVGEVYHCDAATLEALDRLEGHPRFYERRAVSLARGPAAAQAYFLVDGRRAAEPIASGDWRAHQQERDDARDPLAAGLRDLARGRLTSRAVAALGAVQGNAPRRTPRRS